MGTTAAATAAKQMTCLQQPHLHPTVITAPPITLALTKAITTTMKHQTLQTYTEKKFTIILIKIRHGI